MDWDLEYERIAQENRAAYDATQTPAKIAAAEAKRIAEHERGVRLGWWTADGEPIPQPEDEDEEPED